mgnify:CR=1 FL=1
MREDRIRSFIAFDLNDPAILTKISELQSELGQTGSNLRAVATDNLHVTLSFLGEISQTTIDQVTSELEQIEFSPFVLSLRGVGAFPSLRRINVVWVGIDKGRESVEEIFQLLRPKLIRLGIPGIGQRFSPHITIARVGSGRNIGQLSKRILAIGDIELGETLLDILRLKKSVLTPKGPVYTTLAEKRAGMPVGKHG